MYEQRILVHSKIYQHLLSPEREREQNKSIVILNSSFVDYRTPLLLVLGTASSRRAKKIATASPTKSTNAKIPIT